MKISNVVSVVEGMSEERKKEFIIRLESKIRRAKEEEAKEMGFSSVEMQGIVLEEETRKYMGVKRKGGETTGKAKELRGRYREEKWLDL